MSMEARTMELKKNNISKPVETTSNVKKTADFLADVKTEFKKISWTSPEELKAYTKIVVGATFFMGIGVYIIDLTIQAALGSLEFIVRAIFG